MKQSAATVRLPGVMVEAHLKNMLAVLVGKRRLWWEAEECLVLAHLWLGEDATRAMCDHWNLPYPSTEQILVHKRQLQQEEPDQQD